MKLPKNFGKMIERGDLEAIRLTDDEILKSIIKTWRKTHQSCRFGQWLWNLLARKSDKTADEAWVGAELWFTEDEDLIKLIEKDETI